MQRDIQPIELPPDPYAGRWVAKIRGRIVGQGGTPSQARLAAHGNRYKETPKVHFVPTPNPLTFSPILDQLREILPAGQSVYLVGGAVRDALLQRPVHDYDFVTPGNALQIAKQVAARLEAAYFPLDAERGTARVILKPETDHCQILDFAALRGPDLEADLLARDFTINALAVKLTQPQELYDPLNGAADLFQKTLRSCSPTSFADDPVRILRGIRLAAKLGLHFAPESRQQMRASVSKLTDISPERLRDELWQILSGTQPHTALKALDLLGAMPYCLPELTPLKNLPQTRPHIYDAWQHTLATLQNLEKIIAMLGPRCQQDSAGNLILGLAVMRLGRFRTQITAYLNETPGFDRPNRAALFFAALFHDIAKPHVEQKMIHDRIKFVDHEIKGAEMAAAAAQRFHLSNKEISQIRQIVLAHMQPTHFARLNRALTPLEIYRYFRDTGSFGVAAALLSLADLLATYGPTLPQQRWARQLDVVRQLLEAWWENPEKMINPPVLLTGHDLMRVLGLSPGPEIGELLEMVREAQVTGEVKTTSDAHHWIAKKRLSESS